jgi:hypothetical protein
LFNFSGNQYHFNEFLCKNRILDLELNIIELEQEFPNSIYQTLRSFKFDHIKYIDLRKFEKLQILGVAVGFHELTNVIPFLASKFTRDRFQRMQINLFGQSMSILKIGDHYCDPNLLPKHI